MVRGGGKVTLVNGNPFKMTDVVSIARIGSVLLCNGDLGPEPRLARLCESE